MRQELHHILNDFGAGQVVIDKLLYQQLEGPFIACSSLLDQDGIRRIVRDLSALIGSGLDPIRPTISGVTFCGWRSARLTALEVVNPNTILAKIQHLSQWARSQ